MRLNLNDDLRSLTSGLVLGLALVVSFAQPTRADAQVGGGYHWNGRGAWYGYGPYYQAYGPYYRFERPRYYSYLYRYNAPPPRPYYRPRSMYFYPSPYYYEYYTYPGVYSDSWGRVYITPY